MTTALATVPHDRNGEYTYFAGINDTDDHVDKVVLAYQKGKVDLHVCASRVLYHAFAHGDIRPLNRLANGLGLQSNELKKLKVWAGDATRLPDPNDPEKPVNLLRYKEKEGGFSLPKGWSLMKEKLMWWGDYPRLKDSASHFMDYKRPKVEESLDTLDMIEAILRFQKKIEKQVKENDIPMHNDVMNALDVLKAKAELQLDKAKALRVSNEEAAKANAGKPEDIAF